MEVFSLTLWLLLLYQLKHFLADYPLQRPFMLKKFMPGWEFALPLAAHCAVHGLMTLGILIVFAPHLWYLCFVDFVIHFAMDRVKASPKYLGRFKALSGKEFKEIVAPLEGADEEDRKAYMENIKPTLRSNVLFWWSLGLDQMVHHLTHYFIIYIIVMDYLTKC